MKTPAKLRDEVASENAYLANEQAAEQYFMEQSDAIRAIKDTRGFQEIRLYFVREYDACISRFETIDSDDVAKYLALQKQLRVISKFLSFLDTITQ